MRVALDFGTKKLEVDIPEDRLLAAIEPRPLDNRESESDLIRKALDNPFHGDPLRDLVGPGKKVAIIVSDLARPCPTQRLLPPLMRELEFGGIRD